MYSIQRTSLSGCTNLVSNGEELKFPVMWRSKKIGDILKMSIGSTPPKKGDNYNGDIPWVTISNLTTKDIKHYTAKVRPSRTIKTLPPGSLVGSFKMSVGRFGFLSEPSATNEAIIAIPPDATKENLMFLYYALPGVFKKNATLNGQGVPLLNTETIKKLDVILPPFEEQTAIANILSDQEALVAHYNDLIALHEKRFAYLSDELLSGRLRLMDGVVSLNEKWQTATVNGELVEIPAEWKTEKLGKVLTCLDSKRKPLNSKERASQKGTVPYWGANSIVDFVSGHLLDEDVVLLGEDAAPFFDKSKRVAFASRGKIWPNNHVHVLKPKDINFLYAVYILNELPYEQIIGVTVRPKLTQSRMLDIDLIMPSKTEQTLIANVLSDQEALIAEYKKLRDAEQKRFDWLSDALLSGTYRVKMQA